MRRLGGELESAISLLGRWTRCLSLRLSPVSSLPRPPSAPMRLSWLWQLIHSQIASSSAEVYRPHYRVCTAPMPASVTRTAGAAEEHIYNLKSLKEAAALAFMRTMPPKAKVQSMPSDIRVYLQAADTSSDRAHLDIKGRTCPTACEIRVGGFAEAPADALDRPCPSLFSIDLIPAAVSVLRRLNEAEAEKALDDEAILARTISQRYPLFIKLQASSARILAPPIDVALVWFTHILQSKEYNMWCTSTAPSVAKMPHIWTRALSDAEYKAAEAECKKLWAAAVAANEDLGKNSCADYAFSTKKAHHSAGAASLPISPNTVKRDRTWIRELARSTGDSAHSPAASLLSTDASSLRPQRLYTSTLHPAHPLSRAVINSGPYASGWKCDGCGVVAPPTQAVWHCEACSFDLCDTCVAHPQHRLTKAVPKAMRSRLVRSHPHPLVQGFQTSEAYKGGWSCDVCKKLGTGQVWHCDLCQYDLCDACLFQQAVDDVAYWNCSVCNHEGSGATLCCQPCKFVLCEACTLDGPMLRDPVAAPAAARSAAPPQAQAVVPPMLQKALVGYQRYLYLLAKYPQTMEANHFAPVPMVDLMWHTHLAAPAAYFVDSVRLMGTVRHHKLLDTGKQTVQFAMPQGLFEEQIWKEEFGESCSVYSNGPGTIVHPVGRRCGKAEPNDFAAWRARVKVSVQVRYDGNIIPLYPTAMLQKPPPPPGAL